MDEKPVSDKRFRLRSINLKKNRKGTIQGGMHKESILEELKSIPANERGFINFDITENFRPSQGGFTHQLMIIPDKKEIETQLEADV